MTSSPVVLVTGGAQRIGATLCQHLHQLGFRVLVHYHQSDTAAAALVDALNQARSNSAASLSADCRQLDEMRALATDATAVWGRVDVLINNASGFYPTPIADASPAQWDDLMGSNVKGAYFLTQALLPELKKNRGSVVNITDIHAQIPMREYSLYCMAKAALVMMTRTLAKECAPEVRINAIAPGAIAWPEGENTLSETQKNKIISKTALNRSGDPIDIAKAVEFLITRADYMTGQVIKVDGGRHLGIV